MHKGRTTEAPKGFSDGSKRPSHGPRASQATSRGHSNRKGIVQAGASSSEPPATQL